MMQLRPELTEAILSEAIGDGSRRTLFRGDDARRQRYILELESLGLLEARMGDVERGEDPDDVIMIGTTPLGRDYLEELRRLQSDPQSKANGGFQCMTFSF